MGKRQTGGQRAFGVCRTGQPQLITVGQQFITNSGLVCATSTVTAAEGRWPWGDIPWFGGSQNSRLLWVGGIFNLIPHLRARSAPALWRPQLISHPATSDKARSALNNDVINNYIITMCCSLVSTPRVTRGPWRNSGQTKALEEPNPERAEVLGAAPFAPAGLGVSAPVRAIQGC